MARISLCVLMALMAMASVIEVTTQVDAGPQCPTRCTKERRPVCGSNGITYANGCLFLVAKCLDDSIVFVSEGECPTCRGFCPKIIRPVCGSDGITYNNECLLEYASCKNGNSITKEADGPCAQKCPQACPLLLSPVCGSDGVTYPNDCELERAICLDPTISKVSDGNCEDTGVECGRFCPLHYEPVCDSNGNVYSNNCFLNIAICEGRAEAGGACVYSDNENDLL